MGTVKVCEAKKNWATFVGGAGDPSVLEERIEQLKAEIQQTDSLKECEAIQARVNRLASGVAILKIGGSTEIEMMEALHRAELFYRQFVQHKKTELLQVVEQH